MLLRRKFFTFISLFGISFTLLVLMVATAMLDHMLAPKAPETRLERTLGVHSARDVRARQRVVEQRAATSCFDRYARNLPGVERAVDLSGARRSSTRTSAAEGSSRR